MSGDISRSTFDATRNRSAVRQQQGRGELDADWNEQVDLALHDTRTGRGDVIGPAGGPIGGAGMEITAVPGGLQVGAGRYYVDGIRCDQPAAAPVPNLPSASGRYLAYLDVWERTVTAVDDPSIREVALGGPDTATRSEVVWAVRLVSLDLATATCASVLPEWDVLVAGSGGTAQVRLNAAAVPPDPCLLPEAAGYRGLENQLFRIQIHNGNFDPAVPGGAGAGTPTFKWARDNASVVASWGPPSGLDVAVNRLGPGGAEGFVRGGWVEFTTDAHELAGLPGILAQVDDIAEATLTLAGGVPLATALAAAYDADLHPKVRRWDSDGAAGLSLGTWLDLADGLQVGFTSGPWRSGDHWMVAARTAVLPGTGDRQIEWPVDGVGNAIAVRAHGPAHHVARLAIVDFDGMAWTLRGDCRRQFPALTDLVSVTGRGGDGQHAPSLHWLPRGLSVGVTRGRHPVPGRTVRFRTVAPGGGALSATEPSPVGVVPAEAATMTATTGPAGIAQAWWRLGPGPSPTPGTDTFQNEAAQTVVAELLDDGGAVDGQPVFFHATPLDQLVLVAAGGDGQIGFPGGTLEIALRARVTAGSRPAPGQAVAFEVLNRMFEGTALNQFTGGSLHATTNVISTQLWPGGNRNVRAVIATDADGVAQLQWVMGTETRLPVQRVQATLLTPSGAATAQQTLFTAHLGIAEEVQWDPCPPLAGLVDPDRPRHTVQEALDLFCKLFVADTDAKVLVVGGGSPPLRLETIVPVAGFAGLRFNFPFPFPGAATQKALRSVVDVRAMPAASPVRQAFYLNGNVELQKFADSWRITWLLAGDSRTWLQSSVPTVEPMVLHVTMHPALFGSSTMMVDWTGAFRVSAVQA